MGLIAVPLIAAIVSIIELTVQRDRSLYLRAIPLCVLYVIFDVAAALILFVILRTGAKLLDNSPTTAAGVTAGLVAPLLMRTKIPMPFMKDKQTVYTVAMLRRLQIRVKGQIDDICAVGETAWILDTVLPSIESLPLSEIREWAVQSIIVKYSEPAVRRFRHKYIEEIDRAATDQVDENERKHLIIQILLDYCGRGQVTALVRRARKKTERSTENGDGSLSIKAHYPTLEKMQGSAETEDYVRIEADTSSDDELTMSQLDGPGFFHVSFSGAAITVGCSTQMSPRGCFEYVRRVAQGHTGLGESMTVSEIHRTVQWSNEVVPSLEDRTIEVPESERRMHMHDPQDVLQRLLAEAVDVSEDIVALRLDVGSSIWQWDQFSSRQQGSWRCFGGLVDPSNFEALVEVMSYIGDGWVKDSFENLASQARWFVTQRYPAL